MKKVYFARPISNYKTPQDLRDLKTLYDMGFEVINPDKEELQKRYVKEGMKVFENAIEECDGVCFRSFVDGSIGSGVFKEIQAALELDLFIFELPTITSKRVLSVEDTRQYLTLIGQR